MRRRFRRILLALGLFGVGTLASAISFGPVGIPTTMLALAIEKPYPSNPYVIELDIPAEDEGIGGIVVGFLAPKGELIYVVTKPGFIVAADWIGNVLWRLDTDVRVTPQSEKNGLPGWNGPGVQIADVDGDEATEVLYLDFAGRLHIVDARTGAPKRTLTFPHPDGAEGWEHLVVANFRGEGDRDILLQATNRDGYRYGRYLAAYALDAPETPLWTTDAYKGCAHNGARIADIDGDGRDEVLGITVFEEDGTPRVDPGFGKFWHADSLFVDDVRPDLPGLEIVLLEEGGDQNVWLRNVEGILWKANLRRQEPQNAAIGEFDPRTPGLEIWNRTRYNEHQKPFVLDARGNVLSEYAMDDVAPEGWTARGVEEISVIDWTGEVKQLAAAKERHESGDVAIFDPMTGEFVVHLPEKADRLYVADVAGDWREELIVLSGNEIHVYQNEARNPRPNERRLWTKPHYRRSKMTWNYYSP